ncbi:hypothetical protein THAOC_01075 [Thalassiosira oceanica]|uniref:Uncharacterized protein n=1 Tax=Thalassiosira oceanica TaxID=159749 RepID=K0TEI8_THAOC|nr:hypothetical protein THAOC_01075 [Thalassiosira oceanica]|eukprot:EJK77113.1 hypothetical protein THAOC_01075 [Thalassiosira oceanica]
MRREAGSCCLSWIRPPQLHRTLPSLPSLPSAGCRRSTPRLSIGDKSLPSLKTPPRPVSYTGRRGGAKRYPRLAAVAALLGSAIQCRGLWPTAEAARHDHDRSRPCSPVQQATCGSAYATDFGCLVSDQSCLAGPIAYTKKKTLERRPFSHVVFSSAPGDCLADGGQSNYTYSATRSGAGEGVATFQSKLHITCNLESCFLVQAVSSTGQVTKAVERSGAGEGSGKVRGESTRPGRRWSPPVRAAIQTHTLRCINRSRQVSIAFVSLQV